MMKTSLIKFTMQQLMYGILLAGLSTLLLAGCDFISKDDDPLDGDPDQLYPVKIDGQWGYINGLGRISMNPRWDNAREFSDGMAAILVGTNWGYASLNPRGVAIRAQYQVAGRFSEGLAFVRGTGLDDQYGFINKSGDSVIPPQYELAQIFSEGLAAVRVDTRWGYINSLGEMIIDPRYSDARPFHEGLAAVEGLDGWVYINRTGDTVIKPNLTVQALGDFNDGVAPFETGEGWGYMNTRGEPVISPRFERAEAFSEGLAVVEVDDGFEFINRDGEIVVFGEFNEAQPFSEGMAAVRINNDWTFVSKATGRVAMERNFDGAEPFQGGIARIYIGSLEENPRIGYIDRAGEYVWYPMN